MTRHRARRFYGGLAEGIGERYLVEARRFVPYDVMIENVTDLLAGASPRKILDLGSGVGNVEEIVFRKLPDAEITCVELLPNMVSASRKRLKKYRDKVKIVEGDFLYFDTRDKYDAVFSNIAIHNIPIDQKRVLFNRIRFLLRSRKPFIWSDLIRYQDPYLQELFVAYRILRALQEGADPEFVKEKGIVPI